MHRARRHACKSACVHVGGSAHVPSWLVHLYLCLHAYTRVGMYGCVCAHTSWCMEAPEYLYIHVIMHACFCASARVCVHARLCMYTCICVRRGVHPYMPAGTQMCMYRLSGGHTCTPVTTWVDVL
jgi:hypothetical protein